MEVTEIKYVPIDFIKAKVIGLTPTHFDNNPLLEKPNSIFKDDILKKTIYKYKNLSIKIFENNERIELSGSLHTFYNDGAHNYNDFNSGAFAAAIDRLYLDLGIKPENLYLVQLEWGYNIKPPVETNYILDSLIQHKSVNKTVCIDCKYDGKYTQFKHSAKILKIYNKGMHFKLGYELLRIEIKQTNWSKYRLEGIKTLKDFINADKTLFVNELLHQWERIIIYDIKNNLDPKILNYQRSIFWDDLRKNKPNKVFKDHFDKLDTLNESIGLNTKNKIKKLIIKKSNELQL